MSGLQKPGAKCLILIIFKLNMKVVRIVNCKNRRYCNLLHSLGNGKSRINQAGQKLLQRAFLSETCNATSKNYQG